MARRDNQGPLLWKAQDYPTGDDFRQPDASDGFLLSTLQLRRTSFPRTNGGSPVETDPYAGGVVGCFEDNGLSVARTHGFIKGV